MSTLMRVASVLLLASVTGCASPSGARTESRVPKSESEPIGLSGDALKDFAGLPSNSGYDNMGFEEFDKNADDLLDAHELTEGIFRRLDTNADGAIDVGELRRASARARWYAPQADTDGDRRVTKVECEAFINKVMINASPREQSRR